MAEPAVSGPERWSRAPRVGEIDALAHEGFGRGAEAYARGRPGYPAPAIEWICGRLGIGSGSLVLDLGAGTGKLGLALRAVSRAKVVGIEPVEEMREVAEASGLAVLDGTAEQLPVADDTADAVVCGEAFHWFDGERTLAELARVLRPGGGVGLIWNLHRWDPEADWVRAIEELLAPHSDRRAETSYSSGLWRGAFDSDARWTPLEQEAFAHEQRLDPAGLVDHVASVAYVAALPEDDRAALLTDVARIADGLHGPVGIPYRTDAYVSRLAEAPVIPG